MNGRNFPFFKVLAIVLLMVTVPSRAQNLVVNSNFDQGHNVGFTTDYVHSWGLGGDNDTGKYCVHTNAHNCSTTMFSFTDHTTGSGYYMIVNGSTVANQRVWQEQIAVQQYSYYDFTLWMTFVAMEYTIGSSWSSTT